MSTEETGRELEKEEAKEIVDSLIKEIHELFIKKITGLTRLSQTLIYTRVINFLYVRFYGATIQIALESSIRKERAFNERQPDV